MNIPAIEDICVCTCLCNNLKTDYACVVVRISLGYLCSNLSSKITHRDWFFVLLCTWTAVRRPFLWIIFCIIRPFICIAFEECPLSDFWMKGKKYHVSISYVYGYINIPHPGELVTNYIFVPIVEMIIIFDLIMGTLQKPHHKTKKVNIIKMMKKRR